jgi:hypothetical protein
MSCVVSLAIRPVLFALTRALGEAWPADVPRDMLVARAFGAKLADGSHRARLRVEMGRLRTVLRPWRGVSATKQGFALAPRRAGEVVVLARPVEERHGTVLAFLADGESWSSLALAPASAPCSGRSSYRPEWRRPVLLRRRKQREGQCRPPASARLRGRQRLRDPRPPYEQLVFRPNHMIHRRGGVGWVEQRNPSQRVPAMGLAQRPGKKSMVGWIGAVRPSRRKPVMQPSVSIRAQPLNSTYLTRILHVKGAESSECI